jgi:dipeptidyl-peptidase-4
MQHNVYRCSLGSAGRCTRLTTADGSHNLDIAPGAHWAIETHSTLNTPTQAVAMELPSGRVTRTIEDNAELTARLAALHLRPAEFIKVPMPDGTLLDGYRIAPADFDSTQKHPVLMYVYGGPAAPTVNDAWQGSTYLWFQMLAQRGYIVVSVDNRGAAWRGRTFRKMTEGKLGIIESQDQIDAAKWIGRQSWGDASRIGIWGWSYGGYMTTITSERGGDVFRMALAVAPVTDWRLYDSIYTERYMRTPQENPEGYRLSSAQTYVDSLRARFMVIHGTGDDNVHPQNTLQLANRFEESGKLFEMLLYPNRTHGIFEGGVTPQLRATMTRFILEHL